MLIQKYLMWQISIVSVPVHLASQEPTQVNELHVVMRKLEIKQDAIMLQRSEEVRSGLNMPGWNQQSIRMTNSAWFQIKEF